MTITPREYRIAARAMARFDRYMAEWRDACEMDRRDGHTPHYCRHGMSRWTDYDNICGGCESGMTEREERYAVGLDELARYRRDVAATLDAAQAIAAIGPWAEPARKALLDAYVARWQLG